MRKLWKFYRYCFELENYVLLVRAAGAALHVRRQLSDNRPSPLLSAAIEAVERVYLSRQPRWVISDYAKIPQFAHLVTNFPYTWGKCVQHSLICYRLLNGYGMPARVCFGIKRSDETGEGHSWVEAADNPNQSLTEPGMPIDRFIPIYKSRLPE
ncbi:MAG: lasso peptide biosynthesis B2 protein [Acidobacteria bacterium]|nr:lasso peptide biosynthesis B2 protein [Acidobacteriota bacterium]